MKVVAWTNEGKCKSEPASKKTAVGDISKAPRQKPWKTKTALLKWLQNNENPQDQKTTEKTVINGERDKEASLNSSSGSIESNGYEKSRKSENGSDRKLSSGSTVGKRSEKSSASMRGKASVKKI